MPFLVHWRPVVKVSSRKKWRIKMFFIFKLTRLVLIVVNTFHWFALSPDLPLSVSLEVAAKVREVRMRAAAW
jgi:hypothetical protein